MKEIGIKECVPSDYEKVYRWLFYSDIPYFRKAVNKEYNGTLPSLDDFRSEYPSYYFDGLAPEKGRSYLIILNSEEEAGHISYTSFHLLPGICELDIWLSNIKYTNQGIGPYTLQLLVQKLFVREFHTAIIRPSKFNMHAIRAYRKAGFREIKPDFRGYYKEKYLNLYKDGDFGKGNDVFMIIDSITI